MFQYLSFETISNAWYKKNIIYVFLNVFDIIFKYIQLYVYVFISPRTVIHQLIFQRIIWGLKEPFSETSSISPSADKPHSLYFSISFCLYDQFCPIVVFTGLLIYYQGISSDNEMISILLWTYIWPRFRAMHIISNPHASTGRVNNMNQKNFHPKYFIRLKLPNFWRPAVWIP